MRFVTLESWLGRESGCEIIWLGRVLNLQEIGRVCGCVATGKQKKTKEN